MSLVSIISLIVFVLYLESGTYVLFKNPSGRINRWFFLLSFCFAVWALGFTFSYKAQELWTAVFWDKVALVGWTLFPPFLLRFKTLFVNIPRNEKSKELLFSVSLFISLGFLVYFLFFSGPLRMVEFIDYGYVVSHHMRPRVFLMLNIYNAIVLLAIFYLMLLWRRQMSYKHERRHFRLLFYPLLIFVGTSLAWDIVLLLMNDPPAVRLGHIFSIFWLVGVAYGISRLQFFTLTPALAAEKVISEIRQILFFCDTSGTIIKSNPFTEKLLRIRSSRLPGRRVIELFTEEKQIANYLLLALNKGFAGPVELSIRTFQGELVPVSLSLVVVKDDYQDIQGLMIFGQDNREAIRLRNEIAMRQQVEKKLKDLSEVLERKVKERTSELAGSYKELQIKMTERQRVEEHIKADIAEKDVLINEIHNRVKSNMDLIMALINTHRNKGFSAAINKKFRELNRRVSAILLIHENLYLSLNYSEVDFASFLKELVRQLAEFYKREQEVQIHYSVSDVFLDIDHAIPLGLIVNELVSNSFSHGFSSYFMRTHKEHKPQLWIDYGQQQDRVELVIRDNGKGLPARFDPFGGQTNGLPLVDVLVNDQINGSFELYTDKGTIAKVSFPLENTSNHINP